MKKTALIALREFIATVTSRAFIIGVLVTPVLLVASVFLAPLVFNFRNFQARGEVAVIDPTGKVAAELRMALDPGRIAARRAEEARRVLAQAPAAVREGVAAVPAPIPDLQIVERPADADLQQEKAWLNSESEKRHLALAVIHPDAVIAQEGKSTYGGYDLYVPPNLDERAESTIHQGLQDAIVNARIGARSLDRDAIFAIVRLPRAQSVTVTKGNERKTVGALNTLLPVVFALLVFVGVIMGGQALLTSTVEEKSSRVIEVLLSAVSPLQLMTGKLIAEMAASLVVMGVYVVTGFALLISFSLYGLIDPLLIFYLVVFFILTYLVFGSVMMAVGSAVNDMREAQGLMMPIMMVFCLPYVLSLPISRDPNSTFSIVMSFLPPINGFAMLLRVTSSSPPPWWQVWLSIAIGVGSVFGALWVTAKIFRIGLLMFGKAPNFATLLRWVRSA